VEIYYPGKVYGGVVVGVDGITSLPNELSVN